MALDTTPQAPEGWGEGTWTAQADTPTAARTADGVVNQSDLAAFDLHQMWLEVDLENGFALTEPDGDPLYGMSADPYSSTTDTLVTFDEESGRPYLAESGVYAFGVTVQFADPVDEADSVTLVLATGGEKTRADIPAGSTGNDRDVIGAVIGPVVLDDSYVDGSTVPLNVTLSGMYADALPVIESTRLHIVRLGDVQPFLTV